MKRWQIPTIFFLLLLVLFLAQGNAQSKSESFGFQVNPELLEPAETITAPASLTAENERIKTLTAQTHYQLVGTKEAVFLISYVLGPKVKSAKVLGICTQVTWDSSARQTHYQFRRLRNTFVPSDLQIATVQKAQPEKTIAWSD